MPTKKKILFVITKANWGGAQRYGFDMALAMRKKGYQVSVAAGEAGLLAEKLREEDILFHTIRGMGRNMRVFSSDVSAFFSLARIILKEKPDVLHLNSPKAGGMGAFLGRIFLVPRIVYTIHGWSFREERSAPSRALIILFSWLTVVFAHRAIAISKVDYREAAYWPFIKDKLVMIHNGISPFKFMPREAAQKELGVRHEDAWQVGTNAELHPNKNLSAAIEAVALYNHTHEKKIEYTIVGEGEERVRLEGLIAKGDAANFIHLSGFRQDAASLLLAFDAFLLPSLKEGLPRAILEAGLAGLPVIATDTGGISEIIEHKVTGFLIPSPESTSIKQVLGELFENYSTEKGKKLKEKVLRDFSMERAVTETAAVYES